MSFRRSKSIVACGQSHREADGAVWGFAIESFVMRIPVVCPYQTSCLIGSAAVGSVRDSSEEHERSSTVKSSDEAEVIS